MRVRAMSFRTLTTPRIILSLLGIVIALTGLAAFLASQVVPPEATWPVIGRALRPLDQWRQISALLLAAFGIVILFMRPEKLPDRLAIRAGVEDTDPRWAEKRQTSWMLVLSALLVAVWVGILEVPSRNVMSPENRVLLLAGAVLIQCAALFWLFRYVGKRQKRLSDSHAAGELPPCPRPVQALLSPGVGFLLGLGTLALWVGLLLALSGAWPQIMDLPPAAGDSGALLNVMRLTADEMLDTIGLGIPGEYGLVPGPSGPHSWIGATLLAVFRLAVAGSLFFLLYFTIRAGQTYARLTRRVTRESSEEAGAALAAIGRPAGRRLARKALRLAARNEGDADPPEAKALLLKTMYAFYHPSILEFALKEGNDPQASSSDRVEALKYVCTYGDQRTALDLLGRFFHSGDPDLREGVSLICVAFDHPDCNRLLDEMGRTPQTADEYKNAVIGAGLRLADPRADRSGVTACLEVLPRLLRCPDPEARPVLEGVSLLANFATQEVKQEIQAAWQEMPGGIKLCCLEIILKIRAGLLPDPEFLHSVLSNAEPQDDEAQSQGLWKYVTQQDVACLVEISRSQDMAVRDEALDALAKIRMNRADLAVDMPLPPGMMAPEGEPDLGNPEPEPDFGNSQGEPDAGNPEGEADLGDPEGEADLGDPEGEADLDNPESEVDAGSPEPEPTQTEAATTEEDRPEIPGLTDIPGLQDIPGLTDDILVKPYPISRRR
ncbi:MAG: hypothetical protein M1376_00070 [Planctomycetes bacterium]|nr:hypothetical protein [Planctomycetota bacterium]